MMKYETNKSSVFLLQFHLILVTKYRKNVIDDNVCIRLKNIFDNISVNYNISNIEFNHDKNHVHILFKSHPNSNLSKFINAYKSASSRLIKKEFKEVKDKLLSNSFWSKSFFLTSIGNVDLDTLKNYIKEQGIEK